MTIVRFPTTLRNAMGQKIIDAIDAGSGPGTIKFYTAPMPANGDTAVTTQSLLGTLTCSDPSATPSGGVVTFSEITQDVAADATGTATWARMFDSDGNHAGDYDVTNEAGTGAIKLNTVDVVAGGPIILSSFTITIGA